MADLWNRFIKNAIHFRYLISTTVESRDELLKFVLIFLFRFSSLLSWVFVLSGFSSKTRLPGGLPRKTSDICLSRDFTMTCKDLLLGNKLLPPLLDFFMRERRKKYERKVKKKIPETKQDGLKNLSISILVTRKFHRGSQSTMGRTWLECQTGLPLASLAKDLILKFLILKMGVIVPSLPTSEK